MRPRILAVLLTMVMSLACTTNSTSSSSSSSCTGKQYSIYFATFAIANTFWAPMKRGAEDAGRQTCNKVTWTQGTQFSTPETVTRMQVALAAKPDIMVVTDLVPDAFEPIMRQAQDQGIVVIDANAASPNANPPYLFFVGANEFLAGQRAGQETLKAGKPARAACANPVLASVALADRCRGYSGVLKGAGAAVDILDDSGTSSDVSAKVTSYFTAHPDASALYTLSTDPAFLTPILQVTGGLSHKVTIVGNDTSQLAFQKVQSGEVLGIIAQQQYLQGYLPVILGDLYLRYHFLPATRDYFTGPEWIDKSNAAIISSLTDQGIQ